jgi:hypothetical protein
MRKSPSKLQASEFIDPSLGSYCTGPGDGSWRCKPYGTFLLRGRSKHPTPAQLAIWREVEAGLPELIEQALASIPDPPIVGTSTGTFARDKTELSELRLERDGHIELLFSPSIPDHDGCYLSPLVIVKDWKITESYWAP